MQKSVFLTSALFGAIMAAPVAQAMSSSECAALSVQLNKTATQLSEENASLKSEKIAIDEFGYEVDDAIEQANFSPEHNARAIELKAEFDKLKADYNARLNALSTKATDFTHKKQRFDSECKTTKK